ncbi:MAG: hypothetical protein PHH77_02170 [Victivallaceae bacterium]|nr:hypothetical protein [Victivallaceae bacterium]
MNRKWTYRLSIDDNILFLMDIAQNNYETLFAQPYLNFWQKMHEQYGLKVQFNIHGRGKDFSIEEIPDKYKMEWKENSDWLKLAFHQFEEPDSPFCYRDSSSAKAENDYLFVKKGIERFAGIENHSPFTTIHHASGGKQICRTWRECGIRGLGGGTWIGAGGNREKGYYLNDDQIEEIAARGFCKDEETGLYFFCFDVVLHRKGLSPEDLVKVIKNVLNAPSHWPHLEITFEEWAFEPSSTGYVPDAKERVEAILKFFKQQQIRPVFMEEIL